MLLLYQLDIFWIFSKALIAYAVAIDALQSLSSALFYLNKAVPAQNLADTDPA